MTKTKIPWIISLALSALVVAGGFWFISLPSNFVDARSGGKVIVPLSEIREVTTKDHILKGNENAEVYIIEYADVYCPACRLMRKTIRTVVEEYDGKVGWVFRNFPISLHHPAAYYPAVVGECVAEHGGNEKYWNYIDKLFEIEGARSLNSNDVKEEAIKNGVPTEEFDECLKQEDKKNIVFAERLEAHSAGAIGTPFIVIANKKGEVSIVRGGLNSVKRIREIVEGFL